MSNASENYRREKTARSLDTICVHNPTSEDVIIWSDRYGPTRTKTMIPKAQKDIGYGKGNAHIPRYIAKRYAKEMIEGLITKIADKDWEEKKKNYRTLDETLQHADRVAIRTNDKNLWTELSPKVWIGVVEKFGGEALPDPADPAPVNTGDPFADALKELGLEDKQYDPTTESI